MFAPILMDVFDFWSAQGSIPRQVSKSLITSLKKGDKHVGKDLDDYRPIAQLNTVKNFGMGPSKPFVICYGGFDWTQSELCIERETNSPKICTRFA